MLNLIKKLKSGLSSTATPFQKLSKLFRGNKIDAAGLLELEKAFYEADFGLEVVEDLIESIKRNLKDSNLSEAAKNTLRDNLDGAESELDIIPDKLNVIVLVGTNGSGKTTTAAKLAHYFKSQNKTVLLGACDTFRAAANEQLNTWSKRLSIDLVASHGGADAASVAYDSCSAAVSRKKDILILDTAGRLHNKSHLMEELKKIIRVLKKFDASFPQNKVMVLDGSIGTNAIRQAELFNAAIGLSGLISTKLDGTSKGGAVVGIYKNFRLPIHFLGLGEKPEDLQPFSVNSYIDTLFG